MPAAVMCVWVPAHTGRRGLHSSTWGQVFNANEPAEVQPCMPCVCADAKAVQASKQSAPTSHPQPHATQQGLLQYCSLQGAAAGCRQWCICCLDSAQALSILCSCSCGQQSLVAQEQSRDKPSSHKGHCCLAQVQKPADAARQQAAVHVVLVMRRPAHGAGHATTLLVFL